MDYKSIQPSFKGVNDSSALGEEIRVTAPFFPLSRPLQSCRHSHGLFTREECILTMAVVLLAALAILLSVYHKKLLNEEEHHRLGLSVLPETHELKRSSRTSSKD